MAATGKKINELTAISTVSDQTVLPAVYVDGSTTATTATKIAISQISTKVQNDMSSALSAKQDKLTAGDNITISEQNVISAAVDVLPSQSGQSGKFLTTDGSTASWATVSAGANTSLSNLTDTGKIQAAHLAMPSDVYEDMTPVADTIYTSPADGYIWIEQESQYGYTILTTQDAATSPIDSSKMIGGNGTSNCYNTSFLTPVRKNQKFYLAFYGSLQYCRFIYAKGSESEYVPPAS